MKTFYIRKKAVKVHLLPFFGELYPGYTPEDTDDTGYGLEKDKPEIEPLSQEVQEEESHG